MNTKELNILIVLLGLLIFGMQATNLYCDLPK